MIQVLVHCIGVKSTLFLLPEKCTLYEPRWNVDQWLEVAGGPQVETSSLTTESCSVWSVAHLSVVTRSHVSTDHIMRPGVSTYQQQKLEPVLRQVQSGQYGA